MASPLSRNAGLAQSDKEIQAVLLTQGYMVLQVSGGYRVSSESSSVPSQSPPLSFLVIDHEHKGALEHLLLGLAALYERDSVLLATPPYGTDIRLVETSRRLGLHPAFQRALIPDGRAQTQAAATYVKKLVENRLPFREVPYPATINGIRGLKLLAHKVLAKAGFSNA